MVANWREKIAASFALTLPPKPGMRSSFLAAPPAPPSTETGV
jgi:hypothetical protein